ncbi:hypothetical protein [Chitinophaga sp. RAB17]|uniref:hypothetical protein n=1 Tax=Chitinophaga sp. RAB17 TaxID=3233049 RepID=UPI003F8DE6DB
MVTKDTSGARHHWLIIANRDNLSAPINGTVGGSCSTPQKRIFSFKMKGKLNRATKIGISIWVLIIVIIGSILVSMRVRFAKKMKIIHENSLTGIITAYESRGRDTYDLIIEDKGQSKVIPCPAFGETLKSIQIGDSIYKAAFSDSAYFFRKDSNGVPHLKKVDTIRF